MYSIIQYSKFEWLCKAVEMNPFGSDHFFWMDAGSSRFLGAEHTQVLTILLLML